jgi:NCS1 family nucleobase:cation symporter-1
VASLSWFLAAAASLQGPRTGTSTFGVVRAIFGPRGGKGLAAVSWVTILCYEIEAIALISLCLIALAHKAGINDSDTLKIATVLIAMAVQVVMPIFGHATLIKITRLLSGPFLVLFILMTILVVPKVHVSHLSHGAGWATVFIGLTIAIASTGIGWTIQGNDYSRYLPTATKPWKIVWAMVLGGGVPVALLGVLGAAAASATTNASDPISGLPQVFPSWFLVPYLIFAIPQLLCIGTLNFYSSGLNMQAMGIQVKRYIATAIDAVIVTILSIVVIYSGNFNTLLGDFLQLLIIWVAPFSGVFLLDAWLRRNRYDARSLMAGAGGV